jgi:hypothetical protein
MSKILKRANIFGVVKTSFLILTLNTRIKLVKNSLKLEYGRRKLMVYLKGSKFMLKN